MFSLSSWQYWQLTLRRGHSVSTWLVRYRRCIIFPHSLEQFASSNRQPSLLPRWLLMSFSSPCHSQPFSLLVQYIWRLLISLSNRIIWVKALLLHYDKLDIWHAFPAVVCHWSKQDLQIVSPWQHWPVMYASLLGRWHMLHTQRSGTGFTNLYS